MISLAGVIERVTPRVFSDSVQTCALPTCARALLTRRRGAVTLDDNWYCSAKCFELGFWQRLSSQRLLSARRHSHRIPLGLLLLQQEHITSVQLEDAVLHQREHPGERIGQAFRLICGISEAVIAQAVAIQWGCPAFSSRQMPALRGVYVPPSFLQAHEMVPLYWDSRTRTLLVGFLTKLDFGAMAAMERVLQCTVNPCILSENLFQRGMVEIAATHPQDLAIFSSHPDDVACARIVRNYVEEIGAEEVRTGSSSFYLWARLNQPRTLDLLFVSQAYAGAVAAL